MKGSDHDISTTTLSHSYRHQESGDNAHSDAVRPLASEPNQADLRFLTELIETDKVTPVIDKAYPLSEVPEAIRYLKVGHAQGKIVIAI